MIFSTFLLDVLEIWGSLTRFQPQISVLDPKYWYFWYRGPYWSKIRNFGIFGMATQIPHIATWVPLGVPRILWGTTIRCRLPSTLGVDKNWLMWARVERLGDQKKTKDTLSKAYWYGPQRGFQRQNCPKSLKIDFSQIRFKSFSRHSYWTFWRFGVV